VSGTQNGHAQTAPFTQRAQTCTKQFNLLSGCAKNPALRNGEKSRANGNLLASENDLVNQHQQTPRLQIIK
jgi:hypothetical protein